MPVLAPADEGKFETVTYTYYEQLNGYRWLKSLDIGYFFYTGRYVDAVAKVLDPALKTIVHIPSVNSRESLKDKEREVNEIMQALGEWKGIDEATGFHLISAQDGRTLKVADLVDDSDAAKRARVLGALKDPAHKSIFQSRYEPEASLKWCCAVLELIWPKRAVYRVGGLQAFY